MSISVIYAAIQSRSLIQLYYSGDAAVGYRVVEPHMVALNQANHLALSAWFLAGASESQEGEGWREYLIDEITTATMLSEHFYGPRPGYKPDGGKKFHNVQCAL